MGKPANESESGLRGSLGDAARLDAHLTFLVPLLLSEEDFSPQEVALEQMALPEPWQACPCCRGAQGSCRALLPMASSNEF